MNEDWTLKGTKWPPSRYPSWNFDVPDSQIRKSYFISTLMFWRSPRTSEDGSKVTTPPCGMAFRECSSNRDALFPQRRGIASILERPLAAGASEITPPSRGFVKQLVWGDMSLGPGKTLLTLDKAGHTRVSILSHTSERHLWHRAPINITSVLWGVKISTILGAPNQDH